MLSASLPKHRAGREYRGGITLRRSPSPRGARLGLVGVLLATLMLGWCVSAQAQELGQRDPSKAPPSWLQFAKLVKFRFEEWVAAEDAVAGRFRTYLKAHSGASDGPPASLVVRAWLNPDGTVERVSFAAFADAGATDDLRTILTRGNVGEAPPPEMLQPLVLRFSLNLRK